MRLIKITSFGDGPAQYLTVEHVAEGRVVTVQLGKEYIIQPPNPRKLKHRGRYCRIVEWVHDDIGNVVAASVRFADNHRHGKVDLEDLAEIKTVADRFRRTTTITEPDPLLRPCFDRITQFLENPTRQTVEEARQIQADPLYRELLRAHVRHDTMLAFIRRCEELSKRRATDLLNQFVKEKTEGTTPGR